MTIVNMKSPAATLTLLISLLVIPMTGSSQNQSQSSSDETQPEKINGKVVYVCACLGTKSCSCMTEAKMEGPCACGTAGGPPLKPVPKDSAWAKDNRKALGQ